MCIVCFCRNGRVQVYPAVTRVSRRSDGVTSRTLEKVEKVSCGTPQSNGLVATPLMPAAPATSVTNAYWLSACDVVRDRLTLTLCIERRCWMFTETGSVKLEPWFS